jgi:hypothetical protein
MRFAVGVRGAGAVFLTVIVHFYIVCHLLAVLAITEHNHVWRMVKLKELHGLDFTLDIGRSRSDSPHAGF